MSDTPGVSNKSTLQVEIGQRRPFHSLQEEAYLNILRTASQLTDAFEILLKPTGITLVQYNVLRILRGSEPDGLCRNELRDRMLNRMPDVTRLLDRMEESGLVSRSREEADRRQVRTQLTPRARRLVDELDEKVRAEHQRQLGHLSDQQLATLIELLTAARRSR
jgi:DNA-binding MarR family transcriptional regulator